MTITSGTFTGHITFDDGQQPPPPGPPPEPPPPPPPALIGVEVRGADQVPENTTEQYEGWGVWDDGSVRPLPADEVAWSASIGQIDANGFYTAPDVAQHETDIITLVHGGTLSATLAVQIIDVANPPPPPPPAPPEPPPVEPPPSPPSNRVLNFDPATISALNPPHVAGVDVAFGHECEWQRSCQSGLSISTGQSSLQPDAQWGKVARIEMRPPPSNLTVKVRSTLPPSQTRWVRKIWREDPNFLTAVTTAMKFDFVYLSNNGTMRLDKAGSGPQVHMSASGFGGGVSAGDPPLKGGSQVSAWILQSGVWKETIGCFCVVRDSGGSVDIVHGWLVRDLAQPSRYSFFGGRQNNVTLPGITAGSWGQAENINSAPNASTGLNWARLEAWNALDPLGLLQGFGG